MILSDAISIAVHAHDGQKDKRGEDYILHPLRVMIRMGNDNERAIAVLHDVIEDTKYTISKLVDNGIYPNVAFSVLKLSKKEDETYQDYIDRVSECSVLRKIKIADLEDNLSTDRLVIATEADEKRYIKYLTALDYLKSFNKELK